MPITEGATLDPLDDTRQINKIERHRATDEIYQAMPEVRQDFALGEDGLPAPVMDTQESHAPPLHWDTLICMEDRRTFVTRDEFGEIEERFEPSEVSRAADGTYWATTVDVSLPVRTRVEPIRPQCRHYARQKVDFPDNPKCFMIVRLCTARRDSEGEFMSLQNSVCLACELRDPPDFASVERELDAFDDEKIQQGLARRTEAAAPMFRVEEALDNAETDTSYEPNG